MEKQTITAVLLTHNEEINIETCLSALSWCDDRLVIDDESTDDTVKIAKKLGSKVITHALNNDFASQHNFALQQTKTDWVLFIDADETVSPALAKEIQKKIQDTNAQGFYLKRVDHLFCKTLTHGELQSISFIRLGRKDAGIWSRKVHEVWDIKRKTDKLQNPLDHYSHKTLDSFLTKLNLYSTIRARELYDVGVRSNYFYIIAYPLGKFLQTFIWKRGFLDGTAGAAHSILMSFYSFLVRGKLWVLQNKK